MDSYNVFSEFYDLFTDSVDYHRRGAYFNSLIEPYIGEQKLLLDLACGTGSLSTELATLGYDVIGVDGSAQMLSIAQQKAAEQNLQILFLNQRMEALDLYGTIDACVCTLDSLNHLPNEKSLSRAVERVSLFLRPEGVFAFDLNTPYKHTEVLGNNAFVFEKNNTLCVWRNSTKGLSTEITLDFMQEQKQGLYRRFSESFTERAYTMDTIKKILEKNGLKLLQVYGDDSLNPPDDKTERWIFLTQKENNIG